MKILIVYDSLFGNTEKIAQSIQDSFKSHEVQIKRTKDTSPEDLRGIELLIVGSPTHGGKSSELTKQFLDGIGAGALKNMRAAAFDTGIPVAGKKGFMRFLIGLIGYASGHIAKILKRKGATVLAAETFFVLGKEGPLQAGELERAGKWAAQIVHSN